MLALSHFHDALSGWTKNPPRVLAATLHAARRAVELDDDDWLAHALLGIALLWTSRQYDRAQHEVERAIALNPSAVIAHQFSGCVAVFAGRPQEAQEHLETVLQLDPRYQSRSLILADLSLARLLLGDLDGALADAREAIRHEPGSVRAYHRLVAALGHKGPKAEAQDALRKLLQLQPDLSDSLSPVDLSLPLAAAYGDLRRRISAGGMERRDYPGGNGLAGALLPLGR